MIRNAFGFEPRETYLTIFVILILIFVATYQCPATFLFACGAGWVNGSGSSVF